MASSAAEMQKHLKKYYMVFGALLVLTGVTVAVAEFHVSIGWAIVIALFVASIKGSLVACYFMHLIDEKQMVTWFFISCILLFLVLIILPAVTVDETVSGFTTRMQGLSPQ